MVFELCLGSLCCWMVDLGLPCFLGFVDFGIMLLILWFAVWALLRLMCLCGEFGVVLGLTVMVLT